MTDTITDSFCERCGTRYALEKAGKPRRARLGRVRTLTRGVTTFISNDGMPMSEAMAMARSAVERDDVSSTLEAFHRTFNFCMSCRQYTCPSCWNSVAGECLNCAPDESRAAAVDLSAQPAPAEPEADQEATPSLQLAWPTVDLARAPVAGRMVGDEASPDDLPGPPAAVEVPPELEVEAVAAGPEVELEVEAAAAAEVPAPELEGAAETPEVEAVAAGPEVELEVEAAAAAASEVEAEPPLAQLEPAPPATAPALEPSPAAAETADVAPASTPEPIPDDLLQAAALTAAEPASNLGDLTPTELAEIERALATEHHPAAAGAEAPVEAAAVAAEAEAPAQTPPETVEPEASVEVEAQAPTETPAPPAVAAEVEAQAPTETAEPPAEALAPTAEVGRAQTRSLLRRFRPGSGPRAAAVAASVPSPEPVHPAPLATPPPERPAAAATPALPAVGHPVEPPAVPAPAGDTVTQPVWQIVAPDVPTPAGPGEQKPPTGAPGAGPAWPASPTWPPSPSTPSRPPAEASAPWAARLALSRPEPPAEIWAASSREVLGAPAAGGAGAPAVQACVSCGLSLSATARFCRRCGTRQG